MVPYLGLSDPEKTAISKNNSTYELQKLAMLKMWATEEGFDATYLCLIKAFLEANNKDLCGKVCSIFIGKESQHGTHILG